ncbi:transmembrane protein 131-like isoform X2 [Ictalurus punctatus]|uniref:Transmembrane protein 131-like isoform X2 n=1 Tax=Ictalurus punctatus TaxID=7998 RepID=A0A2D0QE45_ICTPU|nr:transmembrane protein 131-like isoform X2 [Ictalurus punctatus]
MAAQRESQHGASGINVLLGVLHILLPFLQRGDAQLTALSHMSSVVEVWQAEDADFLFPSQAAEERSPENLPQEDSSSFYVRDSGRPVRFQPSTLDFGTQPVGIPRAETIYIHNPSAELPVTLQSVFTSSSHFHMPAFHRRVIPPRGKTSFKLIFLPREEGNVANSLFINTSTHGVITYQVSGVGVNTVSVKDVPRKDSVLIFPHIQSIKLTQTQENALNITILGLLLDCSLPKALYAHPQGSCFGAEDEGRLSVQISLSERGERPAHLDKLKPYVLENIMVLLVLPPPGGVSYPKIGVYMLNSGVKQLFVKEIQILSRTDISVEISHTPLKASASNLTQVATLSCRRSLSSQSKKCTSQISVQMLGNISVNMFPWLQHTHRLSDSADWFQFVQTRKSAVDQVELWLINPLRLSFTITNVSLSQPSPRLFKIVNVSKSVGAASGCWKLLKLHLLNKTLPVNVVAVVTISTSLGFSLELRVHASSTGSKRGEVVFEGGGECEQLCPLRLSRSGRFEWQQSLLPESFSSLWKTDSSLASALCSRWHRSKELSCRWPRLPTEHATALDFGATPVNESKIKNFTLKNPTGSAVSVEIRTLSSYPAPLEALDLLTKWFNISPLSVNITTAEFSLLPTDPKSREVHRSGRVQRIVLQPWETRSVSVAYTPTEHKPVTSILLVRNNLTVFDLVLVKGFGAKELLRVGGKLPGPGASLRFNVPQSTLMECRDGLRGHLSKPLFAIQKSFKVENAGELPLTVMSMNINGYKCQGFGFEVLQCRSFRVDYNSSSEITISFTPDFTSSWVIRDLTLITERGSSFPFTLNVTLPHHMLPLCAQVVPGPSWEESFWVVTLVFTCFSLAGVCLMAFHQAQYILREFSTPTPRSNHNSNPRDISSHNTPNNTSKGKGSCKSYSDSSHTSDKGKGRGSTALANGTARSQTSSRKSSGGSTQPQKKQSRVSFLYRYKSGSAANANAANANSNPPMDEEREEQMFDPDPDVCNNNNNNDEALIESVHHAEEQKEQIREDKTLPGDMFPMETLPMFSESITANHMPQAHVDRQVESRCSRRRDEEKRENMDTEPRESDGSQKKRTEKDAELTVSTFNTKTKKTSGKNRRKPVEIVPGLPESGAVMMVAEIEREPEYREPRNTARIRNHSASVKLEIPKAAAAVESPVKQNGICLPRPRRKAPERRLQWESGSDSSSSSGSVRASRGSWGSWSSVEGEKDPSRARHRDPVQYNMYTADRDCYPPANCTFKTQSMNNLYVNPETPALSPSFADVAAGVDRSSDMGGAYMPEETWSAPSVPLTNGFRYNRPEPRSTYNQNSNSNPFTGSFLWNNAASQCSNPYSYCPPNNYMPSGNGHYQNSFPCRETQTQASWSEETPHKDTSSWDMTSCVGSKPYFSGTRSLSPISSSLFGSIWTPQSEPYQSHFHAERSVPVSPVSPFPPEPLPPKHFSSFNPFGPHMNLDIWNNSASNRSSNSQLSNDSGYCADA